MKKVFRISLLLILLLYMCTFSPAAAQGGLNHSQVRVPIIMYHSISDEISNDWSISRDALREDLEYIKNHGYTTILPEELACYVNGANFLPQRPIVLTFDDGYLNNLTELLPLLEEYECYALVSVVGAYIDRQSDKNQKNRHTAFMTWEQLKMLADSEYIRIGSHTWDMHEFPSPESAATSRSGSTKMEGESVAEYQAALREDINSLHEMFEAHDLQLPTCYTYPHGLYSAEGNAVIREAGYQISLTTKYGINKLTQRNPDSLYHLKRINRSPAKPLSKILIRYFGE